MPDFALLSIPRQTQKTLHVAFHKAFKNSNLRCSLVFALGPYLGWNCGRFEAVSNPAKCDCQTAVTPWIGPGQRKAAQSTTTTGFAYGSPSNQLDRTRTDSFGPQQRRGPREKCAPRHAAEQAASANRASATTPVRPTGELVRTTGRLRGLSHPRAIPGIGFRHVVTPAEVRDRLAQLPEVSSSRWRRSNSAA